MNQQRTLIIQIVLFVLTLITTTITGAEWIYGRPFFFGENLLGWNEFFEGLKYSVPFLGVLTIHEFGHYFIAKKHNTEVTLPTIYHSGLVDFPLHLVLWGRSFV